MTEPDQKFQAIFCNLKNIIKVKAWEKKIKHKLTYLITLA